ncbi:hypothetical protein, partial [Microbaculum marinisediminis]|uniref:hypothetical protein n=1 Tax=Microbaculum marinisediminis TaxID=2931392 RepID=UPI0021C02DED
MTVLVVALVATVGAIALHPRCAATAADHAKQYSGEKVNENRSALPDCDIAPASVADVFARCCYRTGPVRCRQVQDGRPAVRIRGETASR